LDFPVKRKKEALAHPPCSGKKKRGSEKGGKKEIFIAA